MSLEVKRLHLASLRGVDGREWPVHGFVVTHPGGAVLVDTGVGGPQELLNDWRVVNRSAAEALADLGMTPGDIGLVINTHLHFDHCGQNAVFPRAACYVQRAELDRARRESPDLYDWFDFMNARFELLDGDTEVLPGLAVIATPGHTAGHQSVVVQSADGGSDLLIGDAAYTPRQYSGPADAELPAGQASDLAIWRDSLRRIRSTNPARIHFCHSTAVVRPVPSIGDVLGRYRPEGEAEAADVERVRALAGTAADPWLRSIPLHVTASALIVHPATGRVLLRWHQRQQGWLQVGGHGDPGESDPLAIAVREAVEETGLTDLVPWPDAEIHHVVIVSVPAGKGEPAHEHADVRFVLATQTPGAARPETPDTPLRWLSLRAARAATSEANLQETLARVERLLVG